jgi:hypothetical protein
MSRRAASGRGRPRRPMKRTRTPRSCSSSAPAQQRLVEVQQEADLLGRPLPVLGRERVHRQVPDPELERTLDGVEQRLLPGLVPGVALQPALVRPPTVAVHDDGDVTDAVGGSGPGSRCARRPATAPGSGALRPDRAGWTVHLLAAAPCAHATRAGRRAHRLPGAVGRRRRGTRAGLGDGALEHPRDRRAGPRRCGLLGHARPRRGGRTPTDRRARRSRPPGRRPGLDRPDLQLGGGPPRGRRPAAGVRTGSAALARPRVGHGAVALADP